MLDNPLITYAEYVAEQRAAALVMVWPPCDGPDGCGAKASKPHRGDCPHLPVHVVPEV